MRYFTYIAVLCVSFCAVAGEFFPKKWERIIKPHREYFPELSDNEFASLNPGPNYHIFFMDIWLNRPLKDSDFLNDQPFYTRDDDVDFQKRLFTTFNDVRLLGSGLGELVEGRNPSAIPILLENCKTLEDAQLKADCLNGVAVLKGGAPEADLRSALQSDRPELVIAAAKVYSQQPYSKASTLLQLAKKADSTHRLNLVRYAAVCNDLGAKEQFTGYLGQSPDLTSAVLPALFKLQPTAGELDKLVKATDVSVRFAVVSNAGYLPGPQRISVLKSLTQDKHISVRANVAAAIGETRSTDNLPQLLSLGSDPAVSVRLAAAKSLREFATPSAVDKLIELTGSADSQITRDTARESLFSLHGKVDIDGPLGKALSNKNRLIRLNAYRNLFCIASTAHGQALSAALKAEKHEDNISEAIPALVTAIGDAAEKQVMSYVNHDSYPVKFAVYDSIGRQKWAKQYEYLKKAARKGTLAISKQAALRAMGLSGDNTFLPEIKWVLWQINLTSEVESNDRGAACWALAHISGVNEELIKRLYKHVTVPLLIAPGAPPSYESDAVRSSATFAMLLIAQKATGPTKELASRLGQDALAKLSIKEDAKMPCGPQLQYNAYQIKQYLAGKAIDRDPQRPRRYRFTLRQLRKKL